MLRLFPPPQKKRTPFAVHSLSFKTLCYEEKSTRVRNKTAASCASVHTVHLQLSDVPDDRSTAHKTGCLSPSIFIYVTFEKHDLERYKRTSVILFYERVPCTRIPTLNLFLYHK